MPDIFKQFSYVLLLYDTNCRKIKNSVRTSHNTLTKRDIEYLTLAALRCENTEIAAKLAVCLSKRLLKMFLENQRPKIRLMLFLRISPRGILTKHLLTDTKNSFKGDDWNLYDTLKKDEI